MNKAAQDDESQWVVKNLDDGEKYSVSEATKKFNTVKITEEMKADAKVQDGAIEDDDEYFDASQYGLNMSPTKASDTYQPLKVPDGARLVFYRISAVGTTKDTDGKAYSVFYLDVSCNVASPNSWFVYRRYSQFRRLSDQLRSEGYIVPMLPPKQMFGNFTTEFIRQRKVELEMWIHNVLEMHATHPGSKDPSQNKAFRDFLTDDANKPPMPLTRIFPEHMGGADSKDFGDLSIGNSAGAKGNGAAPAAPKISLDDFELVRVIGKGSFGKVTLVRKKTDQKLYAMKVLSKPNIVKRKQVEHTKTERRVLGSINHPFIVRLHYAFQTDDKLYFCLDYAGGGELFFHLSRMKKFPESTTRFYTAEITMALDALHQHGVVYRDLKPENILLDGEVISTF